MRREVQSLNRCKWVHYIKGKRGVVSMAVSHRGAISFGMVYIPVGLYTATQDNDIHFNQLCKEDGSRVKYKKICAGCGKEVGPSDIVKGFEYEPNKYVTEAAEARYTAVCASERKREYGMGGSDALLYGQIYGKERIRKT